MQLHFPHSGFPYELGMSNHGQPRPYCFFELGVAFFLAYQKIVGSLRYLGIKGALPYVVSLDSTERL